MNPIRFAIDRPVTVLVGAILLIMFGALAVFTLPIQLTPNVDKPLITVQTRWEGASPLEVEKEIVDEQEEQLKSVQGLVDMTSTAIEGSASIELEFLVGTDINRALLDVADKLRQVEDYPENVDEPVVSAGEIQGAGAIAWLILRATQGSTVDPETLPEFRTLVEEVVKPRLERAGGVARVGVVGGLEKEVQVHIDPLKLAARGLTLGDVRDAIRRRNIDVSAGDIEQGKRSYLVRTVGKFENLAEIEGMLLARRDGKPVFLADVGEARFGFKEPDAIVRALGFPSIAVNATRQSGTNVIQVMASLKEAIADANARILGPRGLELVQVYDQTVYIESAIGLVLQNLWVGGSLTILVLLLFLRNLRSTLIVGVAIPISVIGSFLALTALGRNLNVVSMAGLAFAVGMVVDNSIVVLENIFRHRQEGAAPFVAAYEGAREVWGAVLASTLTTLAVFVPVVFIQEEAGQLFRDIAIAISAGVLLSLLVSVFFIPMAAARLLGTVGKGGGRGFGLARMGAGFRDSATGLVAWVNASLVRRVLTVGILTGAAIVISIAVVPPLSYLPQGNQNLVFGFLIPPPGYNTDEFARMGAEIESHIAPYWKIRDGGALTAEERRPPWFQGPGELPGITNFFFVAFGGSIFMGARSDDPANVGPLKQLFEHAASDIPGAMVFASQRSLFERGIDAGNSIDVEVTGADLGEIQAAAGLLAGQITQRFGFPRPEPANFNLGAPEIRVLIDESRAAELDLNVRDLGFAVQAMVDGAIVSDFRDEGVNIDVKIVPDAAFDPRVNGLDEIPIYTAAGRQVPLSAVARIVETTSPTDIRHIELNRAVKLIVSPPSGVALSAAMTELEQEIIQPAFERGLLPESIHVNLAGTVDKLISTRDALKWNFLLALVITYLLLAALFEHFVYPLVILFSVPLAAVGGFLGLRLVHTFTGAQMDVLTMLGFVILIGTVVNNAILIVHQALNHVRAGMDPRRAVEESVRIRVRPIFMSTTTSVLGMLPLVLFPGAGSELYRGLGSVVVGGLVVSTVFTLVVVPTLFSTIFRARRVAVELTPAGRSPGRT